MECGAEYFEYRFLLLGAGLATPGDACGSVFKEHFKQEELRTFANLPERQQAYLSKYLQLKREELLLAAGGIAVAYADVNGDEHPEACVTLLTTATCSNGVAACQMMVLKDWNQAPVLQFFGHLLAPEISEHKEADWPNFVGVRAASMG